MQILQFRYRFSRRHFIIDCLNEIHTLLPTCAGVLFLLIAALVFGIVVKRMVLRVVQSVAKRPSVTRDDALVEYDARRTRRSLACGMGSNTDEQP